MQSAGSKICPSCGHGDSATAHLCNHCGKELYPNCYKMVADGKKFGVALNGNVLFKNLALTKAQELVTILNSTEQDQVA